MSVGFFGFVITLFFSLQILFASTQGNVEDTISGTEGATMNALLQTKEYSEGNFVTTSVRWIGGVGEYFVSVIRALSWDYPFFDGDWNYIRYVLLILSAATIYGLWITLGPIMIAAAGVVRSLLPF